MRQSARYRFAVCGLLAAIAAGQCGAANYALVVGVDHCGDYRTDKGSKIDSLGGAEFDAEVFAKLLVEVYGFPKGNIEVLTGPRAKYADIEKQFLAFQTKRGLTDRDQFVFYFAGHGTQLPNDRPFYPPWGGEEPGEPDELDEALCPSDALNPLTVKPADGKFIRGSDHHLIVDDSLKKWLDNIPAKRITVVLDSCHSGDGVKAILSGKNNVLERGLLPRIGRPVQGESMLDDDRPGRLVALYACQSNQTAKERDFAGVQQGQFTRFLNDYLRRNNGKMAYTALDEICTTVTAEMHTDAKNMRPPAEDSIKALDQTPTIEPKYCNESLIVKGP